MKRESSKPQAKPGECEFESLFTAFVERLSDHVAVYDADWRYVYVNENALRVLGKMREELIGRCIWDVFPGARGNQYCQELERVASTRQPVRSEHFYEPMGRWFENQIVPLGEYVAVLSRDITDGKVAENAVRAEQRRTKQILESIGDSFVALDWEGRVTYMNSLALRLTGKGADEVLNRKAAEVLPMYSGTAFESAIWQAVREKKPVRFQALGPVTGRWFETTVFPAAEGITMYSRDIHDTKTADEKLRENEERLRLALDAAAIGTWDWDIKTNRVSWSDRIYEFHGLKPGEFGGTVEAFTQLIHAEDLERVQRAIEAALAGKQEYHLEFRCLRRDGSVAWLSTRARVIFGDGGEPVRMLGATIDVTSSKRVEEQLIRTKEKLAEHAGDLEKQIAQRTSKLRQTVQSLEGVTYTIAHDLRAPLRALSGFAQILKEDYAPALDPQGNTYLATISHSAERMDALITDLLAYARLSHAELPAETVNLETELSQIVAELAPETLTRGATIVVDRPLGRVTANRTVLGQVLTNLLSNALKFVEAGSAPFVRISATESEGSVRIFVHDNGIGVAPEYRDKIFGLFQRLHDQQAYPGTGVGLAIVKKAMERLGGSVGMEECERGSRFWIELPRADG